MKPVTLDRADLSILQVLQREGDITNAALAERVFMSQSQVSRRRQDLERTGVIRAYRADVDRSKVGLSVVAFVSVTLVRHSPENSSRLRALIAETPWITDAYAVSGDSDYLLKVVARDLREYFNFVTNFLLVHETVEKVRTDIVLHLIKEEGPVPLEGAAPGNP
jgi:DNA-binding Lrp family transcriptional regulator